MGAFKAEIPGLQRLIARIEQHDQNLASKVDDIFKQGATNIATSAKANVPPGVGMEEIADSITVDNSTPHSYVIGTDRLLAAYVEFGTGMFVFDSSFPFTDEQKIYARQFYINGLGRTHSNPFLFPAMTDEAPKILARVRKLLFGDI